MKHKQEDSATKNLFYWLWDLVKLKKATLDDSNKTSTYVDPTNSFKIYKTTNIRNTIFKKMLSFTPLYIEWPAPRC